MVLDLKRDKKLHVNQLKDGSVERFFFVISQETWNLELLASDVTVSLMIVKRGTRVRVKGKMKFKLQLECYRCGEPFTTDNEESFDLFFFVEHPSFYGRSKELTMEDFRVLPYNGDEIDLWQVLRETIILAIPTKPLCKPDCKGLCPICGANWNLTTCEHQPSSTSEQ